MKGLLVPVPDGRYELRSFSVDEERNNVAAYRITTVSEPLRTFADIDDNEFWSGSRLSAECRAIFRLARNDASKEIRLCTL